MKFSYRHASYQDQEAIVNLNIAEYWQSKEDWETESQQSRFNKGRWWADRKLIRWHDSILASCYGGRLIAEVENKIIGQLDYVLSTDSLPTFEKQRAHIIWLLVDKKYRKQGVASGLIRFLTKLVDVPIWVEAEDERTDQLYQKLGKVNHYLCNFELDYGEFSPLQNVSYDTELSDYATFETYRKQGYQLLIGRYYAPCYDLSQLIQSHEVHQYIWGNTQGPKFVKLRYAKNDVLMLLTQYPRILLPTNMATKDLEAILSILSQILFDEGFDKLYYQIYQDTQLCDSFSQIGAEMVGQDDPVYEIV